MAESRNKLPSSKYKGVVPQSNGRWGAQIYDKHQRVWLGTFNEEDEAARAYDVAVQRFRGHDPMIKSNPVNDIAEAAFLESHSKDEIVDMLRKHTYKDELGQYKKTNMLGENGTRIIKDPSSPFGSRGCGIVEHEYLFEKVVTPSDVGKLNRLVVPKQHAEKHFPLNRPSSSSINDTSRKEVLLKFEDAGGKVWRFRYSYWSSSQSYVLTKGWNRFVKEKKLKAGDTVSFHRSGGPNRNLYIDFKRRGTRRQSSLVIKSVSVRAPVRLFGVDIYDVGVDSGCGGGNKRVRDQMDKLSLGTTTRL